MEFRPALPVVTYPKSSRLRQAAASARAWGRRHLSLALYSLALVGVPVAVILATGGIPTLGFWIVALFWLVAAGYGACVAVFVGFLLLSPIILGLARVFPDRTEAFTFALARAAVAILTLVIYLALAQLGDPSGVHLPGPWVNFGALMVIGSGAMTSWWSWRLAGRHRRPSRRSELVPEPGGEFWSNQPVVGWRAWAWDGSRLSGVHSSWPRETLEAGCRRCGSAPTWGHDCGIYATKRPDDVAVFPGDSTIVGRVEMWGDVIEHEGGYRASHARIVELFVDPTGLVESVEAAYPGVRVRPGHPRVARR